MPDKSDTKLSDAKAKRLYAVRDKNYLTTSPHHAELTKLIKAGDEKALVDFGADKFLPDTEASAEFDAALEGKSLPKSKVEKAELPDDEDFTL